LNFYDIYGYLIPGLTFAIFIWLPRGLITGQWPETDWTSALIAVVIGYVIGHLLQALGRNALPSRTVDGRFPSEALLDKDNNVLSEGLKNRLRQRILNLSGIDVESDKTKSQVDAKVSAQRKDGFVFCRDALLTSKTISYGEQMQGMYTLMIGLTTAFVLGAVYILGWALAGAAAQTPQRFSWLFLGFGLVEAIIAAAIGLGSRDPDSVKTRARLMTTFLAVALLASGYILGAGKVSTMTQRGLLLAIMLGGFFASLLTYSAYKYFTLVYAETIYRAFNLYEKPNKGSGATEAEPHSHHITPPESQGSVLIAWTTASTSTSRGAD